MPTPRLLKQILDEAAAIDIEAITGPTDEKLADDDVIATLPDDLKGLWELRRTVLAEYEKLSTESGRMYLIQPHPPELRDLLRRLEALSIKATLVSNAFNLSVHDCVRPREELVPIFVRKDWLLVTNKTQIARPIIILRRPGQKPPEKPGAGQNPYD